MSPFFFNGWSFLLGVAGSGTGKSEALLALKQADVNKYTKGATRQTGGQL
jgi:hypothetical protein